MTTDIFPEPDLSPIIIKQEYIDKIKSELPALPEELYTKYTKEYGLSDYDAKNLTDSKGIALYYNEISKHTNEFKMAANIVMGPIKSYLNEKAIDIVQFTLPASESLRLFN